MINNTSLAVLIAGVTLAGSSTAAAQTQAKTSAFVEINGGAQTQAREFSSSTSFPLYGETAVINAAQSIDSGGLFDFSGGYRIVSRLSVGVGFSFFNSTGDGSIAASIPSPTVFNNPATSTTSATGLKHSEKATHLMAVWTAPITDKFDATISAGVSFFRIKQDILSASVPTGTQTVNVKTQEETGSATGPNVGLSLNYMLKPKYGVGVFYRYAGATADLPSALGIKVGGSQVGGGLRLRF